MNEIPSEAELLAEIDRRECKDLHTFVKQAWPLVEPGTDFQDNWHIGAICEHLMAVSNKEIRNLGINVPPGMTKSSLVAVFWPAWDWTQHPGDRFFDISFDADLTLRDARKQLQLMHSEWYRNRWDSTVRVPEDVAASSFSNLQGGWRFSTSIEGKLTGWHCDIAIIDDPLKPKNVTKVGLENNRRWWSETLPSRFRDQKTGRKAMIMQRLHMVDLAGLAQEEEGWTWLVLPMRYEPKTMWYTASDPRTKEGELLDPNRFPEKEVQRLEKQLGSRAAAAQLQQRPVPEAGNIFQRKWFKHFKVAPFRFDFMLQSWDCAFKDTDGSDYVCGGVWGVLGAEYYLLDMVWDHLDFPSTCSAVESVTRTWPKTVIKLIEDKANGTAVIQSLTKKIPGILPVEPDGGKESRANAVAPIFEAGNVIFPDPSIAPWVDDLETEMATFPLAAHDDRVDMVTQALNYILAHTTNYNAAMKNAKSIFGLS